MYDVIVVGAGPVGCKTAELIAKEGFKVLVLEEHPEVGVPVQCTGLVSHRILDISGASEKIIKNTVKKAKFYSPNSTCMELKSKKPAYVIARKIMDKEISEMAKKEGANIKTSTRFEDLKLTENGVKVITSRGVFWSKLLVGTDGPISTVARKTGLKMPDQLLGAVQATYNFESDPESVELWFNKDYSKELFGWVVPEEPEWAMLGLAGTGDIESRFKIFVKKRMAPVTKIRYRDRLVGLIRVGLMKETVAERVLVVGDAATQLKPFSGGGITYGLICANYAANACVKALEKERFDYDFLKENYDRKWREKLEWPIRKGVFMKDLIHAIPDFLLDFSFKFGNIFKSLLESTDMDLIED